MSSVQTDGLRALAEQLSALPSVLGVDIHTDNPAHDRVLDVVFADSETGVPPQASRAVADAGLIIHSVQHQAGCPTMWVIA